MYYRRKILLSLLQFWGGKLSNISLQKLLFLFCQEQKNPSFNFIPYKFGCFSFQSYADRRALIYYNILANDNFWNKIDNIDYFAELRESDKIILNNLKERFYKFSPKELTNYVYKNYPYYTLNSEIISDYLSEIEINTIRNRYINNKPCLATIGYEGLTIEQYINELIINNINCVVDVRKNPVSMKFGFSKRILKKYLNKLRIEYYHLPQLGIESSKRKNLQNKTDYDLLFKEYEESILPNNTYYIDMIIDILNNHKRIALTCFESNYNSCHRHKIVEAFIKKPGWNYNILHL